MFLKAVLGFSAFFITHVFTQYAGNITAELGARLSEGASITTNTSTAPRWSDYHAPQAGYIVHVMEETDVTTTIKYCNENGVKFLAQAGGNGWANTFDMSKGDVIINMRGLNSVEFNEEKNRVRVGGGASNGEYVDGAYANGVQVLNGGCNCVGVLGLTLGGGVSRFMNRYGLPADNIVSANLVTAEGEMVVASESSHRDLLWAIRGAGPNFGIITSVVMKAYPTIDNGQVWAGLVTFSGDKLEAFLETVDSINMTEDMTIHWGFAHMPPDNTPTITAELFFMSGDVEAARNAFEPMFDLEPDSDETVVLPYDHLNDDVIEFCEDGGRKPGWHIGLRTLDYPAWQRVWDEWVDFVANTGLTGARVFVEYYSYDVVRQIGSEHASYPHRAINYYAQTLTTWEDASLDPIVEAYSSRVRDIWRGASGFEQSRAYLNFAHGDEPLEEIYGESLPRLRELKKKWILKADSINGFQLFDSILKDGQAELEAWRQMERIGHGRDGSEEKIEFGCRLEVD